MEKEGGMDLSSKYQKLASEYAKIRAQANVLKKAVLEEQAKTANFKDELQAKDQSLRKVEQEMDSITFRNTQLEKRVGFLQDELSNLTNAGKAKRITGRKKDKEVGAAASSNSETGIFDYELLSKIEENIQLHKQISDLEENYRREVSNLKMQLEDKEATEIITRQRALDQLESERVSLTHSLQSAFDENDAYREQVEQLQDTIRSLSTVPTAITNSDSKLNSASNNFNRVLDRNNDITNITKQDSLGQDDLSNTDAFERLVKCEQNKEHWMIEYQLYKMKYSKVLKKFDEAKSILKSLGKDDLLSEEATPSTETNQTFTNMLGKAEVISVEDLGTREINEQKEVNEYLLNRVDELVALIQLANSKAITFHSECLSLESLLALTVQRRLELESKYTEANEELQLTKENYEAQLCTMTEHIATLNDQVVAQKDSIDELKYALSSKGKSKK